MAKRSVKVPPIQLEKLNQRKSQDDTFQLLNVSNLSTNGPTRQNSGLHLEGDTFMPHPNRKPAIYESRLNLDKLRQPQNKLGNRELDPR
jgi:hypothetical protein